MAACNGVRRIAVAAAMVALVASAMPAVGADDPAPLPIYEIGHIWPLSDGAYELVRIENDVYVFASSDAEIKLTKSLRLVSARRGDDYVELTTDAAPAWPLKPGDWGRTFGGWRSSGEVRRGMFGRNDMRLSPEVLIWHVQGYEDVELSGGAIRALKILYQMIAPGIAVQETVQWEIAMWYAPGAGVFVKAADPTLGIVNFELAPAVNLAVLRRRAGLPDPPPVLTSVDSRRRHRDAANDACVGWRCAAPAPRPAY
jgi:hypothetical protein